MRILGIDPGYATIGFGVLDFDGREFKVVGFGAITTPAGVSYTGVTYDLGEMEEVQEIENDNGTTTRIWKLELPEGADAWYDDLTPPVVLQGLKFSSDTLEDKESATISYEYTWDFYGDNADERKSQPLKQTIRLYDSKESATKLEVGKGNYLNWTAIGNEDGNFTKYAMQLAYGLIQTTGAGDTFCGSSLNYILEHDFENLTEEELGEMLTFANAAAAIVTTRKGAIRAMPAREEVRELIYK